MNLHEYETYYYFCMFLSILSTVVTAQFASEIYSIIEGGTIVLPIILTATSVFPLLVGVSTEDGTATGSHNSSIIIEVICIFFRKCEHLYRRNNTSM